MKFQDIKARQRQWDWKELAVLLIIRCLSVLWERGSCLQNKCLEQTLEKKKGQSLCLFTMCFVFPVWNKGVQYKQESRGSHLSGQVEG